MMPLSLFRALMCAVTIAFVFILTKQKFEIVVSAYLLAFGISCFLYYTATFFIGLIFMFLFKGEDFINNPIEYTQPIYLLIYSLIAVLQVVLATLVFRIRRFRRGFPFIFKRYTIITALIFTGIILILVTWVNTLAKSGDDIYTVYLFVLGVILTGIGVYILIRRLMKNYQRMRVQQNTDNHFEKLWKEEQEKNARLTEMMNGYQTATHNFSKRIEAMATAVAQGGAALEDVQKLQNEWQDALAKIKGKRILPSTKIPVLDNLFAHFAAQFSEDKIQFHLMVNGSIIYMVEHIIEQGRLETLLANHLTNAQIAINAGDNPFRSIMAVIGPAEDCYEFTVFDSGIPFEPDTLARLGTERVTTHADTGGSGIGLTTTFALLREYSASFIVNEQKPSAADYTKSVSVRFDGKQAYTIETYRPEAFPASDRYVVASH